MNEPRESNDELSASGGIASNRHQGLRRPADDQRIEQSLDDVGLEDLGEVLEDDLRDRRSRGAPPSQHLRSDMYQEIESRKPDDQAAGEPSDEPGGQP